MSSLVRPLIQINETFILTRDAANDRSAGRARPRSTDVEAMSKMTRFYLVTGLALVIVGLLINVDVIRVGELVALYAALPVGASLLGMGVICRMLDRERERYNAEHPGRH